MEVVVAEVENTELREVRAHVFREAAGEGLTRKVDPHHVPVFVAADSREVAKGFGIGGVVPSRQESPFEGVSHESEELRLVGCCCCLRREKRK